MSILVTGGILIVAIILLIVTFIFATDALFQLGISNLFKTIEEVFEGKNKGDTATDYLIYAIIITGILLGIFILLIVVAIILVVVGGVALTAGAASGVDEVVGVGAVAAEGGEAALAAGETVTEGAAAEGGSSIFSDVGNLLSGWFGTIIMIVLVVVVFTSSGSGVLCFLAAAEIRKEPKYNGDTKLKDAYEDAVIAGIAGIAVAIFAIMGVIAYYTYKHYRKEKIIKEIKEVQEIKQQKTREEAKGLEKLVELKAKDQSGK